MNDDRTAMDVLAMEQDVIDHIDETKPVNAGDLKHAFQICWPTAAALDEDPINVLADLVIMGTYGAISARALGQGYRRYLTHGRSIHLNINGTLNHFADETDALTTELHEHAIDENEHENKNETTGDGPEWAL